MLSLIMDEKTVFFLSLRFEPSVQSAFCTDWTM